MRFSLVGGSGGLGSILADYLLLHGHHPTIWSRSATASIDVLQRNPPEEALAGDRVIYLAWSTADRSQKTQRLHAEAAVRWAELAKMHNVPFVFVSTVLAARDARSEYGKSKLSAEQGVTECGGTTVRVGLVVDDGYPELLASRLRRLARRSLWLSGIAAWPVLPIAGATAARLILNASNDVVDDVRPLLAAERTPVPLAAIMTGVDNPPVSLPASNILTGLVQHYPTSRGSIGRHVDALRGLALTTIDTSDVRDAEEGPIPPGDWRTGIPPVNSGSD